MNGTAVSDEPVVMVEVHSGKITLKTGRISATDSTLGRADDPRTIVAWADKDGLDDIYQSSLRVDNIHLLKKHEAQLLQDADTAKHWFGTIYQDRVVTKIARALKRLKRAEANSVPGEAPACGNYQVTQHSDMVQSASGTRSP